MTQAPPPHGAGTAPARIMVIDDDPEMVALIRAVLVRAGHRVEAMTSPAEGLEKELSFPPDLLLIDLMMPGMSGFELVGMLRDSCAERGIRIMTVSSLRDHEDIARGLEAGADDYLTKPFTPTELLTRVNRQIDILRTGRTGRGKSPLRVGGKRAAPAATGERPSPPSAREEEKSFSFAKAMEEKPSPSPVPEAPSPASADPPKEEPASPPAAPPQPAAATVPHPARIPRPLPTGGKILVIDDDPDLLQAVKGTLAPRGHTVLLAEDGETGLAMAAREEPDLIILDILMPRMDGYEVSRRLAARPHTAFIPVFMLTVKGDPEDMVRGLSGYADEYMAKPFQPDELVARVGALLRRTQRPTRIKREQHWLIEHLAKRAMNRSYRVYSPHLSGVPDSPGQWQGPLPDLLVSRGRKQIAYLVESVDSLHDERTVSRWRALEERETLQVVVTGQSRETFDLAVRIKKENGFRGRVEWMRPRRPRKPSLLDKYTSGRYAVLGAILFLIFLFWMMATGRLPTPLEMLDNINRGGIGQ